MRQVTNRHLRLAAVAAALILAGLAPASHAQDVHECFILSRPGEAPPFVSDATECERKTAPASTFKLPHALVALEAGVIAPDTVVPWDGTPRDFELWQRDHRLDSAIKWSVLPFFQRTARLIGADRMRTALAALRYASDTFDGDVARFWINGDLVISPMEQLAFLHRLFSGALPMAARHVSVVTEAIRMPPGRIVNAAGEHAFALDWAPATIVRAKTGATRVNGEQVAWLVGALELNGTNQVFVARARSTAPLDRTAAIALALAGLNARQPLPK